MFLSHTTVSLMWPHSSSTQLFHTALQLTKMGDVTVWQDSAVNPGTPVLNGFSDVATQLFHTALQLTKMGDVPVWQDSAGEPRHTSTRRF